MARTVFSIEYDPRGETCIRLLETGFPFASNLPKPLDCTPAGLPDPTLPAGVAAYGQALAQRLADAGSPADPFALTLSALAQTPPGERHPLYVRAVADEADEVRWEALFSGPTGFLALRPSTPIGRIVHVARGQRRPPAVFEPPLRVMALLSALGVKARREWVSLRNALGSTRQANLPVQVELLVGESDLLAEIQAEGVEGVRARPLPSRSDQLFEGIDAFKPHVLHAFCHGTATAGVRQLELATGSDWDLWEDGHPPERGSLIVRIQALAEQAAVRGAWLVTLNCCEGGRGEGDARAMAYDLVAAGTGAAIGMQEPVDASDAHEFCRALYPALFGLLARQLTEGGFAEVEWADALYAPRQALLDRNGHDPGSSRAWTLPVLYVREEAFHVFSQAPPPPPPPAPPSGPFSAAPEPSPLSDEGEAAPDLAGLREHADAVARLLRLLPEDTPEAFRHDLLDTLGDLPPELRPDRSGAFPAAGPLDG
jgi:hypothetical protein